jgi:hypothetical protein
MAGPLLFALPAAVGAVTSVAPKAIAGAIERGGDIRYHAMPATVSARRKADDLIESMKANAKTIQTMKRL